MHSMAPICRCLSEMGERARFLYGNATSHFSITSSIRHGVLPQREVLPKTSIYSSVCLIMRLRSSLSGGIYIPGHKSVALSLNWPFSDLTASIQPFLCLKRAYHSRNMCTISRFRSRYLSLLNSPAQTRAGDTFRVLGKGFERQKTREAAPFSQQQVAKMGSAKDHIKQPKKCSSPYSSSVWLCL